MTDPSADTPLQVLGKLAKALAALGVFDFAITGGVALGVWVEPRQTRDIDLCGVLPKAAIDPLLSQLDGIRSGGDEIPDVVRFRVGSWDVDLFVTKSEYDRACLARAAEVDFDGNRLKVVSPEDLLIHKLIKLESDRRRILQDVADMRALLLSRGATLDRVYLERWLSAPDLDLIEAIGSQDDETLLKRLLGR